MKSIKLLRLLARECFAKPTLLRKPEPTAEMCDQNHVAAFHEQGRVDGPLQAVYHFNALATSRLLKPGARILDLGCGSAQYLGYLASRRPDISVVGLDLSESMVQLGRESLKRAGLEDRVELRVGDMTSFADDVREKFDLVSSVFSLHHLPSTTDLKACLAEIAALHRKDGAAVWIFDHNRPKSLKTALEFPEIFTPEAPREFRFDSSNSLIASFSIEEMAELLEDALSETHLHHECARRLPLYQVHYCPAADGENIQTAKSGYWSDCKMSSQALKDFRGLTSLFPELRVA